MSAITKKKLTEAEYLATERAAEFKSEYFNGEMFAIAGASQQHCRLTGNLHIEIGGRLKGSDCSSYSSNLRVKVSRSGL